METKIVCKIDGIVLLLFIFIEIIKQNRKPNGNQIETKWK